MQTLLSLECTASGKEVVDFACKTTNRKSKGDELNF